jgi:hypothetical protein
VASESAAHPAYLEELIAATHVNTVLTEAFGVDWPDAPQRVLRAALESAERLDSDSVARLGDRQIPRLSREQRPYRPDLELLALLIAALKGSAQDGGEYYG